MASEAPVAPVGKKGKRVFIANADLYEAKNIAKYLAACVSGASDEDQAEGEDEGEEEEASKPKEGLFQIVATASDPAYEKPTWISEMLAYETKEELFDHIVECDVIVYNINDDVDIIDEAIWALSGLHAAMDTLEKPKSFILVSTVMTWARTKPFDPEDPEAAFTEEEYRRRKPHPNFKEHCSAEKHVVKLGKKNRNKLATFVLAAGLTYGCGEQVLHYFFREAWHNIPELLCFMDTPKPREPVPGEEVEEAGAEEATVDTNEEVQVSNTLPMIHIHDLAAAIQNIIDKRPKIKYMVAVDDSKHTLEEIVRCVSRNLGSGKIKKVRKEEALLNRHLEQNDFDQLTIDLRMDGVSIKDSMSIRWKSETGIIENISRIVREYKEERNLQPLKVYVHGPPSCGKTTICKQLASHYKLWHLKVESVVQDMISKLERLEAKGEQEPEEGEPEEDEDPMANEAAELLETVRDQLKEADGRLDDDLIIRFFTDKLRSKPCQNQGFILDGFPKTQKHAEDLFAVGDEDDDDEPKDDADAKYNKKTMPEFVIALEAADAFLKERVMNLPERISQGTHHTEEGLVRRLGKFRSDNNEEDSVLNYFDENELHPELVDLSHDTSELHRLTVEKIKKIVGVPRNYGPTKDELLEMKRLEEEERMKKEAKEAEEKEAAEAAANAEREEKQREWNEKLETIRREEHEMLEAQSLPLRNYLMKHVMPTLSKGLIECVKAKPEDGIDFIAEYLFKNNPQID